MILGDEYFESELPALQQLHALGWAYIESDKLSPDARTKPIERNSLKEVVLAERLASNIKRLNPWISGSNLRAVVRKLTSPRASDLVSANKEIWELITQPLTVMQDFGKGSRGQTVRVMDFEDPENNEFLCTSQYHVKGAQTIKPDVVLFVNGLPLAVIECKSPYSSSDPIEEGATQLLRYANRRGEEEAEGAEKLFHYNQMMVSACGTKARVGTITSRMEHFSEWKDPYPLALEEAGGEEGSQQVLLAGLFSKNNFLDIVRNFTVFETVEGRTTKKMPRYQQYRAVHKTIARLTAAGSAKEKSGVIWHTQGSGKSLTMAFLATKVRRTPALKGYKLVFLTDRIQLDSQLTATFERVLGETAHHADLVEELRALLQKDAPYLVTGMMQKFQEMGEGANSPVLNNSEKIIVLTDEAHRTQYGTFGALMAAALPNARYIAFTGTPIEQTAQVFGKCIDTYTIEQSVKDGATVQLIYEGREPKLQVTGDSLDSLFEEYFKDRTDKEKAAIKRKYGTPQAVLEAPQRIRRVCMDIVKHYRQCILPNGFKAMIVTSSRHAAVTYKEQLDELDDSLWAEVVISKDNNDKARIKKHTDPAAQRRHIAEFKKPRGSGEGQSDLSILIVNNMLLTGFDAPIAQVIYLDRNLAKHSLLQAIARVNRIYTGKTRGHVVDYYGLSDNLAESLKMFSTDDVRGALIELKEEIPKLERAHARACGHFQGMSLEDTEACVLHLADKARRQRFQADFRAFWRQMDIVLPHPAALEFRHDMHLLDKIARGARNLYRDEQLNITGAGEKVRKLIDEHIHAVSVDEKIPPLDLLAADYEQKLQVHKTARAKASEIEHAIRHYIKINAEDDPAYYRSLSARLEEIIRQHAENWDELVKLLLKFREVVRSGHDQKAKEKNLSQTELAFYHALVAEIGEKPQSYKGKADDEEMRKFSRWLVQMLEEVTRAVSFFDRWDMVRELEVTIEDAINDQFGGKVAVPATKAIMDLAKNKFK